MLHVDREVTSVELRVRDREVTGELTLSYIDDGGRRAVRLTATCEFGEWTGTGSDIFGSLRALMVELERDDGRIGVMGARANAWASGMQRDMGSGRSVYLLSLPRTAGRPPSAPTLDPAPLHEVGTTAEQDDFHRRWMPERPGN